MTKAFLTLLLLVLTVSAGQAQTPFRIGSLPAEGVLLNQGWKWHAGDNPKWARPDFDDSAWEGIDPTKDINNLPQIRKAGKGWFRIHIMPDSALATTILSMAINQGLASEFYQNGKLIGRLGTLNINPEQVKTYNPQESQVRQVLHLYTGNERELVMAVRFSLQSIQRYGRSYGLPATSGLRITLLKSDTYQANGDIILEKRDDVNLNGFDYARAAMLLILGMIHLFFYVYYRLQKANLYFGVYCILSFFTSVFLPVIPNFFHDLSERNLFIRLHLFSYLCLTFFLLGAIYHLFNYPIGRYFKVLIIGGGIVYLGVFSAINMDLPWLILNLLILAEAVRVSIVAYLAKKDGALIIVLGTTGYLLFRILYFANFSQKFVPVPEQILFSLAVFSIVISITLFLAKDFAKNAHALKEKLIEIETLSAEKEQILTEQNQTLERQVEQRTAELSHKNQELVIEAALERVRTRSLAMHSSEELKEVITVISEQLQALGLQFDYVDFVVERADRGWDCYNSIPSRGSIVSFIIPFLDHRVFNEYRTVRSQGLDFFSYTLTPDEKNQWFTHIFNQTIVKNAADEFKQFLTDSPGVASSVVVGRDITLSIGNYKGVPFTDTENAIFKRFGSVFGQVYTRFLDLKKAEEQAREAKIEAALERVRSRSLALHSSGELKEVIALVFSQLNQLGVAITDGGAVIFLFTEGSRDMINWTVNPDRISEATCFTLPYLDHPILSSFWEAREKGISFMTASYTAEEKNSYWEQIFLVSDYKYLSEETKQWIYAGTGYAYSIANEKHSALYIDSFTGKMYSERENDILKRFARVFEQAYVRFLDLQKAEVQAKEAQIEAALERVRSRSMVMQHSDDLLNVITVVSEQLQMLGFQFEYVNFVVDRADRGWDCYNAVPESGEIVCFLIPYFDHRIFTDFYNARQQGLDFYTYTFFGEELSEWHTHLFNQTVLKDAPGEWKQSYMDLPGLAASVVMWSDIALSIATYSSIPYTDTENAIFKRFGAVFGQAYT